MKTYHVDTERDSSPYRRAYVGVFWFFELARRLKISSNHEEMLRTWVTHQALSGVGKFLTLEPCPGEEVLSDPAPSPADVLPKF
jgi:hypothetical protein